MQAMDSGELSSSSGVDVLLGKLCWFLAFADRVAQLSVDDSGSLDTCRLCAYVAGC